MCEHIWNEASGDFDLIHISVLKHTSSHGFIAHRLLRHSEDLIFSIVYSCVITHASLAEEKMITMQMNLDGLNIVLKRC